MIATSFDESNSVMDTPEGVSPDEIIPLSVCFAFEKNWGTPVIISCWKLTDDELKEIVKNKRIWITIMGQGMQPIYPSGITPFKELNVQIIDTNR